MASLVFEQDRDLCLLHGVFTSIRYNSGEQCKEKSKDIDTIADSERRLTFNLFGLALSKEVCQKRVDFKRKWHTAIFFMTLKNEGISCKEADTYYNVLINNIFPFDWNSYISLSCECDWSEYFLECVCQLPSEITIKILATLLQIDVAEDLQFYSWHLILQTAMWKLLSPNNLPNFENKLMHCFDFPFTIANSDESKKECIENVCIDSYATVLSCLSKCTADSKYSYVVRIYLHGIKTLFYFMKENKTDLNRHLNALSEIHKLDQLVADSALCKIIQTDAEKLDKVMVIFNCKTMSWNVNVAYLVFVVQSYVEDILAQKGSYRIDILSSYYDMQVKLNNICPFSKCIKAESVSCAVKFLSTVIKLEYPCASRAAKFLLSLSSNEDCDCVLQTLESHYPQLSSAKFFKELIDAVLKVPSTYKSKYVKLLHKVLFQEPSLYNQAMEHILVNYHYKDDFVLPDFNIQLDELSKKIMTLDETEKCVLPLMLQVPNIVINFVFSQAIEKGVEGLPLIEALKHMPFACHYGTFPLLLKEIQKFFLKTDLTLKEAKHLPLIIKTLVSVQYQSNVLSFDKFVTICTIPQLDVKSEKLHFSFECFNVLLEAMENCEVSLISSSTLSCVVYALAKILNICIESGNPVIKELILTSFNHLNKAIRSHNNPDWNCPPLEFSIKSFSLVYLYIHKYVVFPLENPAIHAWDQLWAWCCINEDAKFAEYKCLLQQLKYEDLLTVLVTLLRHFTKEEWLKTVCLLEEYFSFIEGNTDYVKSFTIFKGNNQLHAVLQCLIDCVYFLSENGSCNMIYITTCLSNAVMFLLEKYDISPKQLMEIFLSFNHLGMMLDTASGNILCNALLFILKNITIKCEDELQLKDLKIFLLEGIKILPKSEQKSTLLQYFNTEQ